MGNPGSGGWAVLVCKPTGEVQEYSGGFAHTTNNRMELYGVIKALEIIPKRTPAELRCDSQYVVKAFADRWVDTWIHNGWRTANKKPVANRDLWEKILRLQKDREIAFVWVRGHAQDAMNNRCDQLAVAAAAMPDLPPDPFYTKYEKPFL
jgi:ribonuclease HI